MADDKTNPETYVIKHGKDYTTMFESDDRVLDPAIKAHIASLYETVDKPNHEVEWANHFSENAKFKKGANRRNGRKDLLESMYQSWSTIAEREHTVYKVFAAAPHGDEIMFHGRSNNLWKDGRKTTFTWAARMHFERQADGKVLIDEYTIIVDPEP